MYLDPHTSKAKRRLTIQVNNPGGFYMQGLANLLHFFSRILDRHCCRHNTVFCTLHRAQNGNSRREAATRGGRSAGAEGTAAASGGLCSLVFKAGLEKPGFLI
jgi:hypothetical protein